MSITPSRSRAALLLAAPVLLFGGIVFSQDQSGRPPSAQKPKSSASANSTSATSPNGEPRKIVQPTPPSATNHSQDAAAHPARIPRDLNLLSVLLIFLHAQNPP